MIWLNRLNHVPFVLNADMIVHLEVTPDTVIFFDRWTKDCGN
jgi:uncharacterized protein YlzI (FlbEa/FlbD family)